MEWKFSQVMGAETPGGAEDRVTVISFDSAGRRLAVGDQSGRLIVFEQMAEPRPLAGLDYLCEFQSHEKEFDRLKSVDVDARIACIEWLGREAQRQLLLTANEKVVKLWKLAPRPAQAPRTPPAGAELTVPSVPPRSPLCPSPKREFSSLHGYPIHSLSVCADGEKFLTADDFRVNVWSVDHVTTAFNLVDLEKPDAAEAITASRFSPAVDHQLVYSTSRGVVHLADLRVSLRARSSVVFADKFPRGRRSFFTDFTDSIGDVTFVGEGGLATRDYLTVKVWSAAQPDRPVETYPVFDPLQQRLDELYDNDLIFDKFGVSATSDGAHLLTGLYDGCLHVLDRREGTNTQFRLGFERRTLARSIHPGVMEPLHPAYDFERRVSHVAFNPQQPYFVAACGHALFLYNAVRV